MDKKSNPQDETIEHFSDNFTHSEQYTTDPQEQYSKENSNDKNKLKFTKSNEIIITERKFVLFPKICHMDPI